MIVVPAQKVLREVNGRPFLVIHPAIDESLNIYRQKFGLYLGITAYVDANQFVNSFGSILSGGKVAKAPDEKDVSNTLTFLLSALRRFGSWPVLISYLITSTYLVDGCVDIAVLIKIDEISVRWSDLLRTLYWSTLERGGVRL